MDRRSFLHGVCGGLGGIALIDLLRAEGALAASSPATPGVLGGVPHHPPQARRVVQLFMAGAASPIDMFDHKPQLEKYHGKKSDFGEHVEAFQNGLGPWMKSPFPFKPYGQSGKMLSSIVEPLGDMVDEIAFIHNMVGKTGVHSQATYLQATGFQRPGFPGMGCWISYALGSMNDNLPTFVVLPDRRGYASNGPKNWHAAFLPDQHQGTIIRPGTPNPIADLFPKSKKITPASEKQGLDLLRRLNRRHEQTRAGDARLDARIHSYELAARMQLSAPEALDISREPKQVLEAYGIDNTTGRWPKNINVREEANYMGRKCLVARRLLERGVRFVQIWSGCDNAHPRRNWDSHEDMTKEHPALSLGMSHAVRTFIQDLKQRGMLEDTIIHWTTEFGRMPSTQGSKGRDHNPYTFTNWLAGGGIKGGVTSGLSDPWGYKPLDRANPTTVYDVHATILHLLGIDHERLTIRNNGIDRRLTDVHGHVLHDIIA